MSRRNRNKRRAPEDFARPDAVEDAEENEHASLFADVDDPSPPVGAAEQEAKRAEEAEEELDRTRLAQTVNVKINGERRAVTIEELVRRYQKAEAAEQRFQEAAGLRKQVETLIERLGADPWFAFEMIGRDADADAEERVWRRYQEAQLTPEQREEFRDRRRRRSEDERLRAFHMGEAERRGREDFLDRYESVLSDALDKHGVPETELAVERLMAALVKSLENGIEPTADGLARDVLDAFGKEVGGTLGTLDPETIEKLAGEDVLQKIAAHVASKAPQGSKRPKRPAPFRPGERRTPEKSTYTTEGDFNEALRRFVGNGA